MKQKKILIIVFSISLGGAILFIPFWGKDSSSPKKNNQNNKNNQQLPKKEKKSSVLQIILIIGIIIFIFVIFLIIEKRKKPEIKKPEIKKPDLNNEIENQKDPDLHNPEELKKYLSGKFYVRCFQKGKIHLYFCPYSLTKNNETDQLFDFDIHKNEEEIPLELQDIYKYLNEHEQWLKDFGKAIGEFLNFLDGHLLNAIYQEKNEKYDLILINNLFSNVVAKNKIENIYDVYLNKFQKQIERQKDETPIEFFVKVISNEYVPFFRTKNGQKITLFEHYRLLLGLCNNIGYALTNFFAEHENYKNQYQDNFQKASDKIKYFFHNLQNKLKIKI